MAQLTARTLPTPEVRGSNPVIERFLKGTFVYCRVVLKDENKEKEAWNAQFFLK